MMRENEAGYRLNRDEKEEAVDTKVKLAVGAVVFALVAPLTYLVHRLYEHAAEASITFEWRCLIATGIGALCGGLGYRLVGRAQWWQGDEELPTRVRVAAAFWTVLVIFISWWWP